MELQHVKSFEGSPEPDDIFEPHMPGVELYSDMDEVFERARKLTRGEFSAEAGDPPGEKLAEGQRAVAVVTPGRLMTYLPAPKPGSMPEASVAPMRKLMPPDPPLNISVVSYTYVKAFIQDKAKAIPFLGYLMGFAYLGHTVVVFEGHPSAFESGVRGSDVLLVDSGMLPFLQEDWAAVAFRVMRPGAKIFVHKRETYTLMPLAKSNNAQGWRYSEPDGEASYANCLLTMLAKGTRSEARVTSGQPLPDLAAFTNDPEDLDWIAGMPFKYDRLNADEVIDTIVRAAKWRWYQTKGVFRASLATEDKKLVPVQFTLRLTKEAGRRQLHIER